MKTRILILALFISCFMALSCNKPQTGRNPGNSEDNKTSITPEDPEKPEEEVTENYPKGVTVTSFKEDLGAGKYCSGFIAEIDFSKNDKLKFNVILNTPKQKPSYNYANLPSSKGKACLAVNGGYFSGSTSVSMAKIDNFVKCIQPTSMNWPGDTNYERIVYPVRSALGQMTNGLFNIAWIYCVDIASRTHYSFPSALDNNEKTQKFMDAGPTKDTPGGKLWNPKEAIGGGPRLVHRGHNVAEENFWKEVFSSGGTTGTSRQPRTGIGYTADNKLIIVVCDGRNMNGSSGYTLAELADKFIRLGAVDAMNLDGGGSSAIVGKDGQILNKPSNTGKNNTIIERKVVTSIVISELEK